MEDHITSQCTKPATYIICSECSQEGHKFNQCPNKATPKCLNCNNSHSTTSMKCPKRKEIIRHQLRKSKQTFSNAVKQTTIQDPTPTHPQSYNVMTILISAHMHNVAFPGEFNKIANQTLRENGLPEMKFPNNPPSATILQKLKLESQPEPETSKSNHDSQNKKQSSKNKRNKNKLPNKNEETETMETDTTTQNQESRKVMKRTASDTNNEPIKKPKSNQTRDIVENDPEIALSNRFEHPCITQARTNQIFNYGTK